MDGEGGRSLGREWDEIAGFRQEEVSMCVPDVVRLAVSEIRARTFTQLLLTILRICVQNAYFVWTASGLRRFR